MGSFISSWLIFFLAVLYLIVQCKPLISHQSTDVNYAELEALGVSCYPLFTCQTSDPKIVPNSFTCSCDRSCSQYNTCCVDSEFRTYRNASKIENNEKCRSLYNSNRLEIFMVDSCNNYETFDRLCLSNPEESNDPFLLIPVTSDVTGVTYKNYFCAVCNEEVDSNQLGFWNLQAWGNGNLFRSLSELQLKFDKTKKSWTIYDDEHVRNSIPVIIKLKIPQNLKTTVKYCSPDLIESCSSDWIDETVALKCREYMAIVIGSQNVRYRNPHCALCNFESLSNLKCVKFREIYIENTTPVSVFRKTPSSFISLIESLHNVHSHNGYNLPINKVRIIPVKTLLINLFVLEDRQKRCGKNMVYDKFSDKCRCNTRIYRKENTKCVYRI